MHHRVHGFTGSRPSIDELAKSFSYFSLTKYQSFATPSPLTHAQVWQILLIPEIHNLPSFTEEYVRRLLLSALRKSCDLDLIPPSLVKTRIDIIILPTASTLNLSLQALSPHTPDL